MTTKLRKVHDEREARALLAKVKIAGGSIGAWARAHGIDGRSLHAWSRNLARRGRAVRPRRVADPALRMVEIVASSASSPVGGRYVLFLKSNGEGQDFSIVTGYELRDGTVFPLDGARSANGAQLPFDVYRGTNEINFLTSVRDAVAAQGGNPQ